MFILRDCQFLNFESYTCFPIFSVLYVRNSRGLLWLHWGLLDLRSNALGSFVISIDSPRLIAEITEFSTISLLAFTVLFLFFIFLRVLDLLNY